MSQPAQLHAKTLEYLYINASEGNASGGHIALRFASDTFHFQHYDGGIIRLVKQNNASFDYQYRYLENRTFYQASIELNDLHYQQLLQHFNLRFLQQKQQNSLLKELGLNIAFLSKHYQHPALQIKGAGLFAQSTALGVAEAQTIKSIQEQINLHYGNIFLDTQIRQLKKQINTFKITPWPQHSVQITQNTFLSIPYSSASRYIDAVSKLVLLEFIKNGTSLNTQSYFSPAHAHFKLSPQETEQLSVLQTSLRLNLLNLLVSQRPDWGSAGLILYARILSLTHSIRSGKLVFLDSFATNNQVILPLEVDSYKDLFSAQKNRVLAKIFQQKKRLFASRLAVSEAQYSRFEMLSNYYYERERSLNSHSAMRISGEKLLPEKSTPLPHQYLPKIDPRHAKKELSRLDVVKKQLTHQIQSVYGYHLLTRNCVTEIFSTLTSAEINSEQIKHIQNLIDHTQSAFIPFASFDGIAAHFPAMTVPSFRQQQLHQMYQQENAMNVYLREFNTLSATSYKFNDKDAPFLFFTDDTIWLRPLFGSGNILTAAGVGLYGSFTFPVDSGKTLKNGMMGILMSLPELFFFNIRKGSYKYLPPPVQSHFNNQGIML